MNRVKFYPEFYHYKRGASDKRWIFKMLSRIPECEQERISKQCTEKYLRRGRKVANTFLHNAAKEFIYKSRDK